MYTIVFYILHLYIGNREGQVADWPPLIPIYIYIYIYIYTSIHTYLFIYKQFCVGRSKVKTVLYFSYSTARYELCYIIRL